MAELLEYALVFLVSMLFVAGSVATYDAFSAFASGAEFKLASTSVLRLANEAIADGNATGAVTVPASTLSCEQGTLSFSSGNQTEDAGVAASCDFELSLQAGVRSFGFRFSGQQLTVSVS